MVNKINRDKILNRSINLLVINLYSRDFEIPKCKVLHLKFNDNLNLEYKLNGIIMTESQD